MARFKDRERAISLRKEKQMSYSQIKRKLKVSKGTLSVWLRKYPLSEERIRELQKSEASRERFRNTMRGKREKRLKEIHDNQKRLILPIKKESLFFLGLGLYWGEGGKTHCSELSISNSDPSVIKFFIDWIIKCLKYPKEKMKVHLHLYNNMDVNKEMKYWSEVLNIPFSQFTKPYLKDTSSKRINHKGSFGHGTCNVLIRNARLSEKVFMSMKVISDKYNKMRL